jgi:hypothetical protein
MAPPHSQVLPWVEQGYISSFMNIMSERGGLLPNGDVN